MSETHEATWITSFSTHQTFIARISKRCMSRALGKDEERAIILSFRPGSMPMLDQLVVVRYFQLISIDEYDGSTLRDA